MKSPKNPLATLLSITLVSVFVLVVWGGIVRLSGSGLAIPDWPLAQGRLLPEPHPNFLIEYTHRFLAMVVGLLTLGVAVAVYRSPFWRPRLGMLTAAALVTLALQVFMGGRVVLEELPVDRVVAHLVIAFVFFAILLRMALLARDAAAGEDAPAEGAPAEGTPAAGAPVVRGRRPGLALWTRVAALAVLIQVGLGGWVSSSGAALACPDFPTCQGQWIPKMAGLVGIQFGHRLGAYALVILVLGLLFRAAPVALPPRARWPLRISGILLATQFTLGVMNVLLRVPLPVSAAHLGTALALFATLNVAAYEVSRA